MDYENERWIKIYTRDTGGWLGLSWQARGLALELTRKLDAAGKLPLGKKGLASLAGVLRGRWEDMRPFVEELLADERLVLLEGNVLFDPEHETRQTARASAGVRKKAQRDRDALSRGVTRGHAASLGVTRCHDQKRRDQKRSEEILTTPLPLVAAPSLPVTPEAAATPLHEKVASVVKLPPKRKPETPCPDSNGTAGEIRDWAERWDIPVGHGAFQHFLDHHRKGDARWRDWSAAWRTWLKNASRFAARGGVPRQQLGSAADAPWMNPTKSFDFAAGDK